MGNRILSSVVILIGTLALGCGAQSEQSPPPHVAHPPAVLPVRSPCLTQPPPQAPARLHNLLDALPECPGDGDCPMPSEIVELQSVWTEQLARYAARAWHLCNEVLGK